MIDGKKTAISRVLNVKPWLLGLSLAATSALTGHSALANTKHVTHHTTTHHVLAHSHVTPHHVVALKKTTHTTTHVAEIRHTSHTKKVSAAYASHRSHYRLAAARYRHSTLQCVPYAREVSHIELTGNAFLWWAEAAGRYARGNTPAQGAVLNFRSIRRMPLGHVAVVTAVIDSRTILVTQANWIRGTITNDVTMQDVSPNNDWTDVQVELGDTKTWGAAYPTYGFIYNQPATETTIASTGTQGNEVAEAPKPTLVATDAPNRNLQ